ncbi:MAG: nucleotidyltransferase [Calditrichaeota bacterium]|nr:MAG: nucleotidyltransferase [Calditrichota bacterium]
MPVNTKQEIFSLIREYQDQIKKLGVRRLGLFGSFVRGHQDGSSDVDMLVEFKPGHKTFDNFMQMVFLLELLLGQQEV